MQDTHHPDTAIVLTTKGRDVYELDADGYVVWRSDGPKGCDYGRGWKIVGFKTRYNANRTISLQAALEGADVGQGWVCDLDHGTFRLWAQPTDRRLGTVRYA